MSTITVSKEKLISAILGVICALFIIIGSAEKTAVYFVIAILCLIIAIAIHFVNKQCLKKIFHAKEEVVSGKSSENISPVVNSVSDPSNVKPTIVNLQEIKLQI
jgi:hypothetical protein